MINDQKQLSRLEELEQNEEFQSLSEDKKIILIAGEKILEMNEYLKSFFGKLELFASDSFNAQSFKNQIMDDILSNLKLQINEQKSLSKQEVLDLINSRYFEEISTLENKFQFTAQQTINSVTESFSEALQRVESLNLFQVQAREEIRRSQDKIYILEEELLKQKEQNESLRNLIDEKLASIDDLVKYQESNGATGFNLIDSNFESFTELENYISTQAREVAEEKIEEYLLNQDTFFGDGNLDENEMEEMLNNWRASKENFDKIYQSQIENGNRLIELEKLIDLQSQQIELLSQERKDLIYAIVNLIKNKKFNAQEMANYLNDQVGKINSVEDEKRIINTLEKSDLDFLINNQANQIIKDKFDEYTPYEFVSDPNEHNMFNEESLSLQDEIDKLDKISADNKDSETRLREINKQIYSLQDELERQKLENEKLQDELFNEIKKNAFYTSNNGNINQDCEFWEYLNGDDMKYNYYNGNKPIPGTKITRINNYRTNNDTNDLVDQTQTINYVAPQEVENNWEVENQKIIDLENTVQRQEAEINRLKNLEQDQMLRKQNATNNQKDFMHSLEKTLQQLNELSKVQAQTVYDLKEQSRKLDEIERKVKSNKVNENLDEIMHQKYAQRDNSYYESLKKIEDERRKIDETLEVERLRLLTEISLGTKKLNELQQQAVQEQPKAAPVVEQKVEQPARKGFFGRFGGSSSGSTSVTGEQMKKRRQQIFYEVRVHSNPKLTRADIEK